MSWYFSATKKKINDDNCEKNLKKINQQINNT